MTLSKHMPQRSVLAHPAPLRLTNRPTILFVTVCIRERRPLLNTTTAHRLIVDAWQHANRWRVGRYVIMPEHAHLFCAPADEITPLANWMAFWRHAVTRSWPLLADKPLWQRDYWDRQLRQGEDYHEKWEYVRRNPVRAGLVATPDDWPYQGELNVLRW